MTWLSDTLNWLSGNWGTLGTLALQHAWLAGVPLLVGLLIALPLGWLAHRSTLGQALLVTSSGLLYTIPSLALFVLLPLLLGTKILDPVNVIVAMTIYTVALLVRTVSDALSSVPSDALAAARALGVGPIRTLFTVQAPLAIPVLASGLRVAAVSNVSIVSVASLIGTKQLGDLLVDGYNRFFPAPLIVGIIACVLLALLFDALIQGLAAALTPWRRAR